jgi:trimethylamine-N-oxide reductase (cytochrome c)
VFDSSDVAKRISWAEFCKKGYYVVPAEAPGLQPAVQWQWFAQGRPKDIPEAMPLPSQWSGPMGQGLQTPSGKLEFMPETLQRHDPHNPERPVLNRYIPSWEGRRSAVAQRFPLQLVATHSRYSFHTNVDGKGGFLEDIEDHRVRIDGHPYWVLRLHPDDAAARGIAHHSLVKVFNDRGAVICAADVSPVMAPGVVKSWESSAEFLPVTVDGERLDVGGSLNVLTSSRPAMTGTHSMAPNACMVQVAAWQGPAPHHALTRAAPAAASHHPQEA